MNIFNFTAHSAAKKHAESISNKNVIKKELCAKDAVTQSITGLKADGVMNVKNVIAELRYEAAPLCKVQIFRFWFGIKLCFY